MSNEISEIKNGLSISPDKTIEAIEIFTAMLNQEPPKDEIFKGPDGKSDEIPVSFIESKLDEIYSRQWGYESISFTMIANEICCDVMIFIVDPQTKLRITRAGTASLPVMMDALPDRLKFIPGPPEDESKARERNLWALDMQNKKPFALKLQRGAVKALALKNAAKSLGKIFGRDLNRKHTDTPDAIYTDMINTENDLYQAKQMLINAKTEDDFTLIWDTYDDLRDNDEFKKEFMYRKRVNIKKP